MTRCRVPRKEIALRLLLLAGATILAFACVEGALRAQALFFAPQEVQEMFYTPRAATQLYCVDFDRQNDFPINLNDPARKSYYRDVLHIENIPSHEIKPAHCIEQHYNDQGYRASRFYEPARSAGTWRIAVFGDSFVEGIGVKDEHIFTSLLEPLLTKSLGRPVEVLNFGLAGSGVKEVMTTLLTEGDRYSPDVAVYLFVLNDPVKTASLSKVEKTLSNDFINYRAFRQSQELGALLDPRGSPHAVAWFARSRVISVLFRSLFARKLAQRTVAWYGALYGAANEEGWRKTCALAQQMKDVQESRGRAFVVGVMPLLVDLDRYPFRAIHEQLARAFRDMGIASFDLLSAFEGKNEESLWVSTLDRHPNALAHAEIASALEQYFSDHEDIFSSPHLEAQRRVT